MVLKSRIPAPDWSASNNEDNEALCRKFPLPTDHDVSKDPWFHDMHEAKEICNGTYSGRVCPFRERCLHISLVNNEGSGVFGGLLPIQRKWVRRNVAKDNWQFGDFWREEVPSVEELEAEAAAEEDEEDADDEEEAE